MENKPKIMYIEDEEAVYRFMNRFLSADYDVLHTTNLEDALSKIDNSFKACISDGTYPKNKDSGLYANAWKEVYQAFKKLDKNIPFILTTTNSYNQGELEAFTENDPEFILIEKPFEMNEIGLTLKKLLGKEKL